MKHSRTASYHPQSNELAERFHGHLKSALRAQLTGPGWIDELPWVLLGIGTAPKADLRYIISWVDLWCTTPCQVILSLPQIPLRLPAQFCVNCVVKYIVLCQYLSVTIAHHHHVPSNLHSSQYAFVRRYYQRAPLEHPYEGPFKVVYAWLKVFTFDRLGNWKIFPLIDKNQHI